MTDDLVSKLERMAERGTPHEADVARSKLTVLAGRGGIPPRRPAAPAAAPAPEPHDDEGWFTDGMRNWRVRNRNSANAWNTATTSSSSHVHVEFSTTGGRPT